MIVVYVNCACLIWLDPNERIEEGIINQVKMDILGVLANIPQWKCRKTLRELKLFFYGDIKVALFHLSKLKVLSKLQMITSIPPRPKVWKEFVDCSPYLHSLWFGSSEHNPLQNLNQEIREYLKAKTGSH